jgi:hypothetical protein
MGGKRRGRANNNFESDVIGMQPGILIKLRKGERDAQEVSHCSPGIAKGSFPITQFPLFL